MRLVDPRAQTVEEAARSEVDTLYTTGSLEATAEPLALHVVFGAQSTPTIDVMLPYTGYVADVPVVEEAAVPAAAIDGSRRSAASTCPSTATRTPG